MASVLKYIFLLFLFLSNSHEALNSRDPWLDVDEGAAVIHNGLQLQKHATASKTMGVDRKLI
ncbi:hypothetical protein DsansV1_C18g0153901 [Dioscorea sansibarensis]